jgi:predicted nucleic acid-binding protein
MTSGNSVVITDTSCFILLEKINSLDILHRVFATVLTTPEIAEEYGNLLPEWVIIQSANQSLKEKYSRYIDEGEASAIALACEIPCDYVILDDIAARKLAERLHLPIKGTVGILLSAKQKGIIPLFRPYLDLIQQTNFRLSSQLVEQFIKDAGE